MATQRQKRRNQFIWTAITIVAVLSMIVYLLIPLI